jgi:hypothetical protein
MNADKKLRTRALASHGPGGIRCSCCRTARKGTAADAKAGRIARRRSERAARRDIALNY